MLNVKYFSLTLLLYEEPVRKMHGCGKESGSGHIYYLLNTERVTGIAFLNRCDFVVEY